MYTLLPEGTLVQIKPDVVEGGDSPNSALNKELTDEHGWLWVVEGEPYSDVGGDRLYDCRSIATGEIAAWFRWEITAKEEANGI